MANSQKASKMSATKDKAEGKKTRKPRDPNKPKVPARTDVFNQTFTSPGGKSLKVYVKRLRSGGYESGTVGGADLKRGTPKTKYKTSAHTTFEEGRAKAQELVDAVTSKNWALAVKQVGNYGGDEIPDADSF